MKIKKNILIVNYSSPPNTGIGGRRWAIFSHFLSQKGYVVHVLCKKKDEKSTEKPLYQEYISPNENIHLHYLPNFCSNILNTEPKSLVKKIWYKIWLKIFHLLSRGSPYDPAAISKKTIQKQAKKLIERHHIKTVIVTCAPFSLAYYFSLLRVTMSIQLIIDFRDPWAFGYGFLMLSKKRQDFEIMMESMVIKTADYICVPAEIIKDQLDRRYPKYAEKIKLLPHGYDPERIVINKRPCLKNKLRQRIIFIGSLYEDIGMHFECIARALADKGTQISLDIFSDTTRYSEIFENKGVLNSKVNYFNPINPKKLFEMLKKYDFVFLIHPDSGIHNISTKFYEIIYSNTPIVYIANKGLTSKFVIDNKVGIHIEPSEVYESLLRGRIFDNYHHEVSDSLDISKYSYDVLTDNLIRLFENEK